MMIQINIYSKAKRKLYLNFFKHVAHVLKENLSNKNKIDINRIGWYEYFEFFNPKKSFLQQVKFFYLNLKM